MANGPLNAYPNFGTTIAIPQTSPPASIAGGGNWQSGLMPAGFGGLVVGATLSQTGTITIQRYADLAGNVPVGAAITQAMTANTAAWAGVNDGLPFISWSVEISNTSGSAGNLTNVALLTGPGP